MNARCCQTAAAIFLSLLFAGGCGSDKKDGTKGGDDAAKVSYDSPQAAFDAAKAAVDKSDWSAFCMCLEPASREKFVAMLAMMSAFEIAFAGENGDEGSKHADAIKAVFAKHGITEEMLAADSAPAGDTEQAMVDFIKPIEDRMAFVADMSKVHGDKLKKSLPIQGETKLSDVTEDGATAKGTITFKMLDEDKSDTVHFRKVDGSWGIELTDGP